MGLINLDNVIRVGKQIFIIFMDNIYTTKSTILKYTQKFSSCGLYSTYIHAYRQRDRHIHTCITYTNGDGNFNIRLQYTL